MNLEKILLSRPYSWICVVLIALTANVLATGSLQIDKMFLIDVFTALWMWFTGLSILEFMHNKHEYGKDRSRRSSVGMFLFLVIFSTYMNFLSLPLLGLFLLGVILYSIKVNSWLGRISFLFRGLSELSLFLIILSFHHVGLLNPTYLMFSGAIYFLTASRNLVGDLRDVEVDEHTLAVYDERLAQAVSIALGVAGIIFVLDLPVIFPIVVMLIITSIFGKENGYTTHRIYVIATTFFVANYLFNLLGASLVLSNLLFLGVLLNFTYDEVPRKISILK